MDEKKGCCGKASKGFTLIELLVVIAIIGILATIVLVSLNSARQKARDTQRVADVKQFQTALEMYFDSHAGYPATYDAGSPTTTGLPALATAGYLPAVPNDPLSVPYDYCASDDGTKYHLGTTLEDSANTALSTDIDNAGTICTSGDFDGTVAAVYDVTP